MVMAQQQSLSSTRWETTRVVNSNVQIFPFRKTIEEGPTLKHLEVLAYDEREKFMFNLLYRCKPQRVIYFLQIYFGDKTTP